MSQINISEIDSTSTGSPTASTFAVLIPGTSALVTGESGATVKVGDEFDFTAANDDFKSKFGTSVQEQNNVSYKMAYHLLELGLPVHYVVIASDADLYDATEPGSGEESAYDKFWKKFADKSLYDLRFITSGGFENKDIAANAARCAAERGDAVTIVDVDETNTTAFPTEDSYNSTNIEKYAKLITKTTITRKDGVEENSLAYASMFAPKFTFDSPYFKDDKTKYPAKFGYLAAFAAHNTGDANFPAWFPTAGSVRGVLPYDNIEPVYKFGDADNALLQDRTTQDSRAVNPIQNKRPYGNVIWGARTLYPNPLSKDGTTVGLVASSFLNIRQLCCSLKKRLYEASNRYTFDPNSDTLWINFKALVNPVLEEMKENQGIKGYRWIRQTATEKATLKARIQIIPIEPVEDFYLTVHMVDSIVDVSVSE